MYINSDHHNSSGSLGWSLVGEKTKCSGRESAKGNVLSITECASHCKEESSMFIFGTNDFGGARCLKGGCECFCETSAKLDGSCELIDNNAFRLYKYNGGDL